MQGSDGVVASVPVNAGERVTKDQLLLSTTELGNAKMKLTHAESGDKQANAAFDRVRYRLHVSARRAPFDAVVLSRHAGPGQSVAAAGKKPHVLEALFTGPQPPRAGQAARIPLP